MSAALASSRVLFLPELQLQFLALPTASLCGFVSLSLPRIFFFSSLNKEFGYSNVSVIKEQLVLQHCDEQYLFLQSIWYPRWGKLCSVKGPEGEQLTSPSPFASLFNL